jgi:hypothetical protein
MANLLSAFLVSREVASVPADDRSSLQTRAPRADHGRQAAAALGTESPGAIRSSANVDFHVREGKSDASDPLALQETFPSAYFEEFGVPYVPLSN